MKERKPLCEEQALGEQYASAMSECETMRVEKTKKSGGELDFSKCSCRIFWRGYQVEEDLVDQLFNSTEKRLATCYLLPRFLERKADLSQFSGKDRSGKLAGMIGTTRSRVSHFMNKFRELGFIDYNGHLDFHNSKLSVLLAEQPAYGTRQSNC